MLSKSCCWLEGNISCTHDKTQALGLRSLTYSEVWSGSVLFSLWFELGLNPAVANDDLNSMKSREDNNSGSVLGFDKTMVQINLWFWFYFLLNSCIKKNIWNNNPAGPISEAALSYCPDSTNNNKAFKPVFNNNNEKTTTKQENSFCALQSVVARTAHGTWSIPASTGTRQGNGPSPALLFWLGRKEAEHSKCTQLISPCSHSGCMAARARLLWALSCAWALPSMGWSPARELQPPDPPVRCWILDVTAPLGQHCLCASW